ncbi:MAG: integrase arm-type DNA-binding domain-containing protein, partial [Proteobacteria bacterium]|nr:integrase arm-type DNA-binding domain-containing protein [Pseudomonadota bacterium]
MPKKAKDLSALEVSRLTTPGHHAVGGVAGLYLYVLDTGARSWVLRTMVGTKRRHMGLGGYPDVPLAQAREKARAAKGEVSQGTDPIAQRAALASQLRAQQATQKTFEEAAKAYMEAHEKAWKNPKHRAQWGSTLKTYAYPHIGSLLVKDIDQEHVMKVLEPIWATKTETATRLRGRIESVLDWATTRKYRSGENPARWKGHLDNLLPAPSDIQKVESHRAVDYNDMAQFMAALRVREGLAARALEFAILCASRSGEVRGALWSEINREKAIWTIPAERMKAGKEHRVPLSTLAVKLLEGLPRSDSSELVFAGADDKPLSDMALTAVMRRMEVDAVPHGFRSTFRDWVGDCTNHPRDVAEFALAHKLSDKVEASYRRGDALEKRRQM